MATLGTGRITAPKATNSDLGRAGTLSYGMTLPAPAPPPTVPPLNFTPPTGGPAPTPTPYGTFTAPDQATFNRSADSLYLQGQQQKAIQRSAAARGTLLSGGLLGRLQQNAEGLAAQDYQNEYNRQLGTYTTNRDTNAQNFGQQLGAYTAMTNANLGYGRLGLEAAQANHASAYQNAQDQQGYQQQVNDYNAGMTNLSQATGQAAADAYAQQVAQARAQAQPLPPMPKPRTRRPYGAGPFR